MSDPCISEGSLQLATLPLPETWVLDSAHIQSILLEEPRQTEIHQNLETRIGQYHESPLHLNGKCASQRIVCRSALHTTLAIVIRE
jgi:hypothetical protein